MAGEELLLSERDLRFAARRRQLGLAAAPLILLGVLAVHPANMAPRAATLLAILVCTLSLWVSQALPVAMTALVGPALVVVLDVAPAAEVFAPFGHPMVFLFLGAYLLAVAAERTRLDRLLAFRLFPDERLSPERTLLRTALVTAGISGIFSRAATTAMMVPVVRAAVARLGPNAQAVGILNAAFASSIGGVLTPIGNPANLIALACLSLFAHRPLPFFHWSLLALPLAVATMSVWALQVVWALGRERRLSRLIAVPEAGPSPLASDALRVQEGSGLWGLGRGQWATVAVLTAAMLGWVAPGALDLILPADSAALAAVHRTLPEGVVAILAGAALFVLPTSPRQIGGRLYRRPILLWGEAVGIEWGTLLVFGGAMSLGQQAFATGLGAWLGDLIRQGFRIQSEVGLTAVFSTLALVIGELTSSTATAAILCPLAVMAAQQLGVSPVAPVVAAALAASMGFLMPMSAVPNAIAFGTGSVPLRTMLRYGLLLDLVAAVVIPPSVLAVVGFLQLR